MKNRSKFHGKNGSVRSFLFLLIFSAKDDPVKVSWKSDAQKCQNQLTPPYFDQLSESHQPFGRERSFCFVINGNIFYSLGHLLIKGRILKNDTSKILQWIFFLQSNKLWSTMPRLWWFFRRKIFSKRPFCCDRLTGEERKRIGSLFIWALPLTLLQCPLSFDPVAIFWGDKGPPLLVSSQTFSTT